MSASAEQFTTVAALDSASDTAVSDGAAQFTSDTQTVLSELKSRILLLLVLAPLLVVLFSLVHVVTGQRVFFSLTLVVAWSALLVVAVVILQLSARSSRYRETVEVAILPILTQVFGAPLRYVGGLGARDVFTQSQLVTTPNMKLQTTAGYHLLTTPNIVLYHVLVLSKKTRRNSAEQKPWRGMLIKTSLKLQHSAETYITTDKDRSGFAQRTFWSDLFETGRIKETVLEWNEFEENFHIASSNPTAARELLTPDTMQALHDWWIEHKLDVRVAVKGSDVFLLLPESKVRIAWCPLLLAPKQYRERMLKLYLKSTTRDLWRTQRLVQSVGG